MKLNQAIALFTEDYSELTARTYRTGLRRFIGWMRETGMLVTAIEDFDPKWVIPFARGLKREGLSPRSIGTYVVAVVQFLKWLKREKLSSVSAESLFELGEQVKSWNKKNTARTLPRLPKEKAVVAALEMAHEIDTKDPRLHLYHLRNMALVELLSSTGCRISEAANLKRNDLNPDKMTAWVREGKGRKDREIVFASEESWEFVQAYLTERDKLGFTAENEPVFSRHDRDAHRRKEILPMTTSSMRVAWNRLLKQAGTEHFTPHQLRHRAGTAFLRQTGNLELVRQYLGHADISTTANTYTHLDSDDLIKALRGG